MDKNKVTKWLSKLNTNSYNKKYVLTAILEDCNYEELELIYQRSPQLFKGLLSLSYLKRNSYSELFSNNIKPRRDIKGFIGVVAYILKHNSGLVNKYIEFKRQIERAILTGQYKQAREWIDEVNTNISYSYWAATCLIKIARLEKGLNECTDLYNQLCNNNDIITRQIYYCAYRSSSLDFIDEDLKRVLVPKSAEYSEFVNNFLITHCMPYWGVKEGEWICADTNSSIIDFYNNFLVFLPNLGEITINDTSVRQYLKELNTSINDPYLKDSVATFIFDQFLRRHMYQQGVCFFVENRLKDKGLVIGIRENEALSNLYDNKELARKIPLELSIFAEMVGADADSIYLIYKKYLWGLLFLLFSRRPSELHEVRQPKFKVNNTAKI